MEIRRLEAADDRSSFSCGDVKLDDFFRQRAGQNQKARASVTYVALKDAAIHGFVTVIAGTVRRDEIGSASRLPLGSLPVLLLARMGVSSTLQRSGTGTMLVKLVLKLALEMSNTVGCVGVIVDAKTDAKPFYERFDFNWLSEGNESTRGFLSVGTIEAATGPAT